MPRPLLYFIRHGETDWNRERRLQGQRDIPLNALGRVQASRCGEILRDLLERDAGDPARIRFRVEPAWARPRDHGVDARRDSGLDPEAYRTDARLMEMSFGRWEGFTFAELRPREARRWPNASATNGASCCRAAKATRSSSSRARLVRELARDTVVVGAWRRVRGLIAHLGIVRAEKRLSSISSRASSM